MNQKAKRAFQASVEIQAHRGEIARREQLIADLERQLNELVGESTATSPADLFPINREPSSGPGSKVGSQSYRLLTHLAAHPRKAFSLAELSAIAGSNSLNSFRTTLYRLVSTGKIKRAGRGKYRAKSEAA